MRLIGRSLLHTQSKLVDTNVFFLYNFNLEETLAKHEQKNLQLR